MENPKIKTLSPKKLLGTSVITSLANDKTYTLWNGFMKRRKEISNAINNDLYSVQVYNQDFIDGKFTSKTTFEKWATVEVTGYENIPEAFEKLELPSGLYAVFIHKGSVQEFAKTAQFIYAEWIPKSEYQLDDRPHFEILGEKYKGPDSEDNEEEVWVPIKKE